MRGGEAARGGARRGPTLVMTARIPAAGVDDFQAYEAVVLPLIAGHGGRLERRLRSDDGTFELHIVSFPDEAALAAFRADPRRQAAQPLLARSGASVEVSMAADVP